MTSSASSAAGRCYDARNNAEASDELKTLQVSFCSSCSRRPNSGIGSCVCLGSAGSGSDGGTGGCADPATHAGGHTVAHAGGYTVGDGCASDSHRHAGSDRAASDAHEHAGADVHAATEADGYATGHADADAAADLCAQADEHAAAAEPDCGPREWGVVRSKQATTGDGVALATVGRGRG